MKTARLAQLFALIAVMGISGFAAESADAQTPVRGMTGTFSKTVEIPVYQIQVQYMTTYGSRNGRVTYVWVPVAQTENLAEAEFIYELYLLAQELGVLDEVAPDLPGVPLRVRMITWSRTESLGGTATLR